MTVVEKVWGREEIICNGAYAGKRMVLNAGASCSWHYHRDKDETFWVEFGQMVLEIGIDDDPEKAHYATLASGVSFHVRPGERHRFTGGPWGCVFFEFSTRDDPEDSVRLIPSKAAPEAPS